jgi:hypothetical protein
MALAGGIVVGSVLSGWRFGYWLTVPMVVAAMPIVFLLSSRQGYRDAVEFRRGIDVKPIQLFLKKEARASLPEVLLSANDGGRLKAIVQTKDDYYILLQPAGLRSELPLGRVYRIRKEDVVASEIELPQRLTGETEQ